MKATFIVPPALGGKIPERVAGCSYGFYFTPNIYALYPAAVLEKLGFEVLFRDFAVDGNSFSDFQKFLEKDASDAYFLHGVNISMETDLFVLQSIRKARSFVKVFFLGPAPTYFSERFLKDENTFVVRGEPEETILEIAKKMLSGQSFLETDGLSFFDGKKIVANSMRVPVQNLDDLPFPARHLIDRAKYFNPKLRKRPFTAMIASRGCSFQCIYCVPSSLTFARELEYRRFFGKKPRVGMRSVENVLSEVKQLAEEGYKTISFLDDQFVWGEQRAIDLCNGIGETGIEWGFQARADLLTEKILLAMEKNNCVYLDIGVESFHQPTLDFIKKNASVETMKNAVKMVKRHNIDCKINVMFGASPHESVETIAETKQVLNELEVDQVMYNIATPFPGTEFYDVASRRGWLKSSDYKPTNVSRESPIDLPKISGKELEHEIRKANFEFFLNPGFVLRNVKKVGSLKDLADSVKAVKRKLL